MNNLGTYYPVNKCIHEYFVYECIVKYKLSNQIPDTYNLEQLNKEPSYEKCFKFISCKIKLVIF